MRRSLLAITALTALSVMISCTDSPSSPARPALSPRSPQFSLNLATEYLCGASISPASQSVWTGTTVYISTTLPVCSRSTGQVTRYDHTTGYWSASDYTPVYDQYNRSAGHNATDQAHLTVYNPGTVTVTTSPCCDYNAVPVTLTSTIYVSSPPSPLGGSIQGPTQVNVGSSCNITYTAYASGGAGGYTYYWETDGTIKQNNGSSIVAAFTSTGPTNIAVVITDAANNQVTKNFAVSVVSSGGYCTP